jgi:hypothetical protein
MNDKTSGNRGLWDAGALAVAATVTVLATACGGGSAPSAASTAAAYTQEAYLRPGMPSIGQLEQKVRQARQAQAKAAPELRKYFQCVQSHGVPNQAALTACQHLLPPGTHASLTANA